MCGNRRVLLVEDHPAVRRLLRETLTDAGYAVQAAVEGAAALTALERATPCLILLDLRMPGMDGWAFARAYRQRPPPHAAIVVMTAEARLDRLEELAPAAVVRKPFNLDAVLAVVHHHVAAHAAA